MPRKTPILLRQEPFSKRIVAVTKYSKRKEHPGIVVAAMDGKHDVTQEFCALCVELGMGVPPGYEEVPKKPAPPTSLPSIAPANFALPERGPRRLYWG